MEGDDIGTPNRKKNLNMKSSGDGSAGGKFLCEFCCTMFAFKWLLNTHIKRKHKVTCQPGPGSRSGGQFICEFCSTKFAFKSSLNKHLNRKHEVTLSQPGPGSRDGGQFICEFCSTKFAFKSSLNKHLKRKHNVCQPGPSTSSSLDCKYCCQKYVHKSSLYRHMKQKHPTHQLNSKFQARSLLSKPFICKYCKHSYSSKTILKRHIKIKHVIPPTDNISGPKAYVRFCNICQFSCYSFDMLISHYKNQHELHIQMENYTFGSYNIFLRWKEDEEKRCINRYVKKCGAKVGINGCKNIIYHCHRSGFYKSKSTGKRRLKIQGSRKIGTYCPSRMLLKIKEDGKVLLKYVVTHVGHYSDLSHMNLSATERTNLANKVALRIPFENILDEVSNSAYNESEVLNSLNEAEHVQLILPSNSSQNEEFQQAKKQYLLDYTQYIEQNINTPEELSLVKKITQSIKPTIEALKQQPVLFPKQTSETANKNIVL